ncbi:MAG: hypothetical protein II028_03805, partial [Clostridia bacterium]|nr:hypothetical protein [Clostridia bacterium]
FGRFLCENGQKHHDPPRFFAKNAANSGPQAGAKLAKKPSAAGFSTVYKAAASAAAFFALFGRLERFHHVDLPQAALHHQIHQQGE